MALQGQLYFYCMICWCFITPNASIVRVIEEKEEVIMARYKVVFLHLHLGTLGSKEKHQSGLPAGRDSNQWLLNTKQGASHCQVPYDLPRINISSCFLKAFRY
jgi:hypothetical protein